MFLLPLLLLRGRSWLDRVDLAVVLLFGVSYLLFNNGHLEPGVWMFYPAAPLPDVQDAGTRLPTAPRSPRPLDFRLPTALFAAGLLALIVARIVVTLLPASVLDVGTASALGRPQDSARPEPLLLLARPSGHLWSAGLSGLRTVRGDLARELGLHARRPRGDDHLRPDDDRRADRLGIRLRPGRKPLRLGLRLRGCGRRARSACSGWRRAPTMGSWR